MDVGGEVEELEVHVEIEVTAIDPAEAFEEIFVPALFHEWGPRVVAAARVAPGDRVLDVACGTGVLARAAAAIVGPAGSVTGLDIDPGMLAVARSKAPEISWQEGSAESLPFADGSFDAVVSQFGLMFFGDKPVAIREMWRVLRPGGRLAVAVWASLEATPAYAIEADLIERVAGSTVGQVLRAPFALGDTRRLAGLFAEAGIPDAVVTAHTGTGRFASIRQMVEVDLRAWLPVVGHRLDESMIAEILRQAEHDLARFARADGSVEFDSPACIVTAGPSPSAPPR